MEVKDVVKNETKTNLENLIKERVNKNRKIFNENVQKNADRRNSCRNHRNCNFCYWYITRNLDTIFCNYGSVYYLCCLFSKLLVQTDRVYLSGMPYQISTKENGNSVGKS